MEKQTSLTRRQFVGGAAAALAVPTMLTGARAQGKTFKVGLIGCGGRGRGAAVDSLGAGKVLGCDVKIVAVADYFKDRAVRTGQQFGVPENRCFGGPAAYQALMETDAEIVLMATAPAFRPLHLEAAVKAGKHVFIEKPVAVDPVGVRRVIAAGEEAKKKGVVIVAGTERRHDHAFRKTHQACVVEKQLGRLYAGRIAFCMGHIFSARPIQPKTADDLVRTWQSWLSLSGDHIVEQHVHNIDTALWFAGRPPVSAVGFGGRARRNAGDMYDFFDVDYDFGDMVHIHSMCRQVEGCFNWDGQEFVFEKGRTNGFDYQQCKQSPIPADLPAGRSQSLQEQIDVLYCVNKGQPLDEVRAVAESTAAAIMGRISAYTGQPVYWDQIMVDPTKKPEWYNLQLKPAPEDFEKGEVFIPEENVIPHAGRAV